MLLTEVNARCNMRSVHIVTDADALLTGDLDVPDGAVGLIVFAHGSGSGRRSPRNRQVAGALHHAGLATLLVDLLTADEARIDEVTAEHRFDIDLLARRLAAVIDWAGEERDVGGLPIGLFGASTGAAAALVAAALASDRVGAIVSRGGRPDLAGAAIGLVRAPTLLIVGGEDREVLRLNQRVLARFRTEVSLEIVPGAGHLFEEPGTLDRVAILAARWFLDQLVAGVRHAPDAPSPP
jgi:pimeloyl-ACP methyl ester carboxylesterase